ncbi:MAG: DUF1761 domain-containing protein [bacterium]|nr:DUF1761 domain-containing protein [bacterium]
MHSIPVLFGATISAMLVGALWYAPFIFGRQWQIASNTFWQNNKGNTPAIVTLFVTELLMAYVLSFVLLRMGSDGVWQNIQVAGWLWLGFVATTALVNSAYEKKSFTLFAINTGHHLMVLVVMAIIFALA